jgi:hypothetical protein
MALGHASVAWDCLVDRSQCPSTDERLLSLSTEGRARTVVVGDHDDAALEHLDGVGQRAQRVAVQVVGRLILGRMQYETSAHDQRTILSAASAVEFVTSSHTAA